jgi:hypothetical protein
MPRPLDTRLDREEGRRTADAAERGSAAIRRRHIWRAEAAIGAVIRSALARAGVDAAQAIRLCLADQAATALAALSDTPELQRADSDGPAAEDCVRGDAFKPKILALARGFVGAAVPDLAKASFAELFAWSLAQPPASDQVAPSFPTVIASDREAISGC